MERIVIEVLADVSTFAIVRMPSRSYPGRVIQGDSLSALVNCAHRAHLLAVPTDKQELIDEVMELKELLEDRRKHYETVVASHGYDLRYFPSITG